MKKYLRKFAGSVIRLDAFQTKVIRKALLLVPAATLSSESIMKAREFTCSHSNLEVGVYKQAELSRTLLLEGEK